MLGCKLELYFLPIRDIVFHIVYWFTTWAKRFCGNGLLKFLEFCQHLWTRGKQWSVNKLSSKTVSWTDLQINFREYNQEHGFGQWAKMGKEPIRKHILEFKLEAILNNLQHPHFLAFCASSTYVTVGRVQKRCKAVNQRLHSPIVRLWLLNLFPFSSMIAFPSSVSHLHYLKHQTCN